MGWTADDIPPGGLAGKTIIVTGGNSGIGFEASRAFAGRGAQVVLACRNPQKAGEAVDRLLAAHADAQVDVLPLDLASLASVRDFAKQFSERYESLDALCNNAGVMALPLRRTADGFEMQLGTNHLGHFALTGLLAGQAAGDARLARRERQQHHAQDRQAWISTTSTTSSDLLEVGRLRPEQAGQPAVHLRAAAPAGARRAHGTLTAAAHPGYAATNLQFVGPQMHELELPGAGRRAGEPARLPAGQHGLPAHGVRRGRTRTWRAAATTGRTASRKLRATPRRWRPRSAPTTRPPPRACGSCRRR